MDAKYIEFFKQLTSTPSPSGHEEKAQRIFMDFTKPFADEVKSDINGNAIAVKYGTGHGKKPYSVMLSGHADEIGLMVSHIDESGYVYARMIGGMDISLLPGLRLDIHHEGKTVRAIVGKKPIHMLRDGDEAKPKLEDLWLDIGAIDREDALKKVAVGDVVTFIPQFEYLNGDFIVSKGTDDKAGVFVAAMVMNLIHKSKKIYPDVYAVSTVGEEVGAKGAKTSSFDIKPMIAIALDVTFVSDHPGVDKKVYGDVGVGKGPAITIGSMINKQVLNLFKKTAEEEKIPVQFEISPTRSGTDGDVLHNNLSGIALAIISIPNRYMHSPNEVVSLNDMENAAKLIAGFLKRLGPDFNPYPVQ
ncbi:MAG TPA: M20/M25/M40 family metallo-hydrolase [Candidatus Cloacimonadota bacterium]|nr:M20/M25/M40 family metallo-hydrolase [Candidatus Cloacimonadota bacterium]HPT72918.1 M20/M25/M40 family metallo-hydrolase [Candidatus Cloacimonadota bacterium]